MIDECGYCGSAFENDVCTNCGRERDAPPYPFVVYGPGVSGNYRTLVEAQSALANLRHLKIPAALFVMRDGE